MWHMTECWRLSLIARVEMITLVPHNHCSPFLEATWYINPHELLPSKKTRSRRQLRPRCFWLFINRPSLIFDNPYRVSSLCINQHHSFSMVFAWLWVRHSWFIGTFRNNWLHTRLEKTTFFHLSSSRPGRPVCSKCSHCPNSFDKRRRTHSLGCIHSHPEWADPYCAALWERTFSRG